MAKEKLTPKERLFCKEYLKDFNASRAYLRAGYACTERTARSNAYRLKCRPEIEAYINKLIEKRSDKLGITATQVLARYWQMANADVKDYIAWKGQVELHEDPKNGPYTTGPVIDVFDSEEIDAFPVQEISYSAKDGFKIKLADKKGALDAVAKHLGMFVDKTESIVKSVDMSKLTNEQLERLADGEPIEKVLLSGE